jgi:hypothetical protein
MALGYMNRICFQLMNQDQITGTGAEADVTGNHIRLPCKCKLVDVDISADVLTAGSTAVIKTYAGTTKSGTEVSSGSITTATPRVNSTAVAAQKDVMWAKDQEFCISENTTNAKNIDGLCVVLTFRTYEE